MACLEIDARGRSCPEPVLLTKKAVEKQPEGKIVVLVDNTASRDNIQRFAKHAGYRFEFEQEGSDYRITLSR